MQLDCEIRLKCRRMMVHSYHRLRRCCCCSRDCRHHFRLHVQIVEVQSTIVVQTDSAIWILSII
jgi:hypothetical protein